MNYKITDAEGNEVPLWIGPLFASADEVHDMAEPFWAERRRDYRIVRTA